jgi:hypothetical protein
MVNGQCLIGTTLIHTTPTPTSVASSSAATTSTSPVTPTPTTTPTPVLGQVGNQLFFDNNNNGIFDAGDTPITNVVVGLYNASGTLIAQTTTNSSGQYLFSNLPLGCYKVGVISGVPAGYSSTHLLGGGLSDNTAKNPAGYDICITGAATSNMTGDFGYYKPTTSSSSSSSSSNPTTSSSSSSSSSNPTTSSSSSSSSNSSTPQPQDGSIGNQLFRDNNNNGIFDAGDTPIPGVSVALYKDTNCNSTLDSADTVYSTQITNQSGNYLFSNLPYGCYIVKVTDTANVLVGLTNTRGVAGADNNGQDPNGYAIQIGIFARPKDNMTGDLDIIQV